MFSGARFMIQRHDPLGLVEELTPFRVRGWAFDRLQPSLAIELVLRVDGSPVQWFRPHLRADAIAHYLGWDADALGLAGFDIAAPEILADGRSHHVEVVHAATGAVLSSAVHSVQYISPHAPLAHLPLAAGQKAARAAAAPDVTVVVLNRNGSSVLKALLESWENHNRHSPVEWVVIDHASTDDSLAMLRSWQKRLNLRVKALKINDSFSASCNLGARLARGSHLLFLNNDIVWLHDALPHMLQTLRDDPEVGIVGIKLLKAMGDASSASTANTITDVQHLGVRFKQQDQGYWPYEVSPSHANREAEFTTQQVPVITGAALLCRKADFDAVGGFDSSYFYGFEDVELCLRLSHRLRKRVVCRNDLAALHRHGHTRLTGREARIFDRVQHNAQVLNQHMGLWAKVAWWRSLLSADGVMCSERLTIGLQVGYLPPLPQDAGAPGAAQGHSRPARAVLDAMAQLGSQLQQQFASCRVVLVHPGIDAFDVRGLHALVVTSPHYDIRRLHPVRPDLRAIAWVQGTSKAWASAPWWLDFDGYVTSTAATARALARATSVAIDVSSPQAPLGRWLKGGPDAPAGTALRVAICLPFPAAACAIPAAKAAWRAGAQLRQSLKAEGAACWLLWADEASQPHRRVVDACVLLPGKPHRQALPAVLDPGCLNVVWQHQPTGTVRPHLAAESAQPDLWLRTPPRLADLQQALETRVGHTFLAP